MCETGRRTPICFGQNSTKTPSMAFAKLTRQRSPDMRLSDCHADPDKVKMLQTFKGIFALGKHVAVHSYNGTIHFSKQIKSERDSAVSLYLTRLLQKTLFESPRS